MTNAKWPARDAYPLAVSVFEPSREANASVLIAGATAVRRQFYKHFAAYLGEHQLRVVTFDYRGIGDSLRRPIRTFDCRMQDWGGFDLAGLLDQLGERFPDIPIMLVGHSAGGQLVGLADNNDRISAMITVGAQSGYWQHWPRPHRYLLCALWYGLMPGLTWIQGYFPARRLGLGEDLPAGIVREWSRWCRHPDYFCDPDGRPLPDHLNRFTGPMISYSIADDWMAPRAAVDALFSRYEASQGERRHIDPAELGLNRLGHFGFFRSEARETLWPEVLAWLTRHI